ncbi:hypothetical protein HPB47_017170, partial [Ixodes persulcatus]
MLTTKHKEVQSTTLLMTIGEEARKAYATFVFEAEEEREDVNMLMEKFESFYQPATNLTYNEFRFGIRDQREGETFNGWLTEFGLLASRCEFGVLEERMLRSRIILGIKDKKQQQRLVSENPPYATAVEIRRAREQGQE